MQSLIEDLLSLKVLVFIMLIIYIERKMVEIMIISYNRYIIYFREHYYFIYFLLFQHIESLYDFYMDSFSPCHYGTFIVKKNKLIHYKSKVKQK